MTSFMLGWAVTLYVPGNTFSISSYKEFRELGLKEDDIATFFLSICFIRAVTLWKNGHLKHGPEIRFFCAFCGVFVWLTSAMLFALPWFTSGMTVGLPVSACHNLIMALAEFYAIGVARFDRSTHWR